MKLNEAQRILGRFTEKLVLDLGFRRIETLIFARKLTTLARTLSFPCRLDI